MQRVAARGRAQQREQAQVAGVDADRQAQRGEERGRAADEWALHKRILEFFINTNFDSLLEKISRMIRKI
jgi:hypothetical protein